MGQPVGVSATSRVSWFLFPRAPWKRDECPPPLISILTSLMAGWQAWDFLSGNGGVRPEFPLSQSPTKDQWNPLFLSLHHPQMQGETQVLCSTSAPLLSANPENSQLAGILAVLQVISGSDQLIVPKSRPG